MSRTRLIVSGLLLAAVALFFVFQSIRWSGQRGAERAHARFLSYVEDKRWSKCHGMISEDYSDQWDFTRNDISLAMQDLGSVFTFWLSIEWQPSGADSSPDAKQHALSGTARFDGQGGAVANLVASQINGYASEPFTFRWRREGLLPWKWRLFAISHPSAKVPPDYTPGDLRSARF